MKKPTPLALALSAAGLAVGALVAVDSSGGAGPTAFHDPALLAPVLSDGGGFCLSRARDGQSLFRYYEKVAVALSEVRPFPTRGPTADGTAYHEADPPLWDNLGALSLPVTTSSAEAQRYFDQGLRLAFAFNHAEARRAFRKAQRLDPGCALCWWGEALVLGPNINAPMAAEALEPTLVALGQAEARAPGASEWELALVEALATRYSGDLKAERADLDAAYAAAMSKVAVRFPEADHIQVLYAEALMNLSPWDYWEAGGSTPKGRTAEIVATLERVLARSPDHAGAIHYYIHMVEASDRPERAEPYARRLADAMPGAGHVVHMPFHIYFRLGKYRDAIAANQAAVAVDRAYVAQAGPEGIYPRAYYPHNLHSLMASAQMAGDGRTAVQAAEDLSGVVTEESGRAIPWVQPILAAPYFAHAQFSAPETVIALPDPGAALPYVRAMWRYARGVALARQGDTEAARGEAEAIARLGREADFSDLTSGGVPAPELVALARHVVLARIAQSAGDLAAAQEALEEGVAIQDGLGYMEPPHWYYPVRQSLGAVQLMGGDLAGAEETFRQSLVRVRHNGWALYGLREVYRRAGQAQAVAEVDRRLEQVWAGDPQALDLARL
jgi:tetratricopeptide (TPR) repeat protein